ncbi:hypothetical protein KXD40_001052 [Peronospora effusa]|nr:hypothetical protein KXD40_001052 [Peronospora effusa]
MDLHGLNANDGTDAPATVVDGQIPALDPSVVSEVVDTVVSAKKNEKNKTENEITRATDSLLDDVSTPLLATKDDNSVGTNDSEDKEQPIDEATLETTSEASNLVGVETNDAGLMAANEEKSDDHGSDDHGSDDRGSDDSGSDDHESDDCGSDDHGSDDHESDGHGSDGHGSDGHGSDDYEKKNDRASGEYGKVTIQSIDTSDAAELLEMNDEATIAMQQKSLMKNASMDESAACQSDTAESSVPSLGTHAVPSDGQADKDTSVEKTKGEVLSPSTYDQSECDSSTSPTVTPSVPHGDDEYDPANPTPVEASAASNTANDCTSHSPAAQQQEEYDPDHPSITSTTKPEEPVAMEIDHTNVPGELSTVTPAKRKIDEETNISSDVSVNGTTDTKRPRFVDGNKSPRDDKHSRNRCESGDSTLSSSSKQKHHEEDHKGLSAVAWDRLMDFQTTGEFRVTQVSRAAFASVGAMPEFAQISIIARFVRTPMRDIRDKNGQLMRIFREYQKENPQIAVLQPVDAFISDYKSDPRLFRFGYAPPQPVTGMSNVQVPYQLDQLPKDLPVKTSPRQARSTALRSEPEQHQQKDVDEFGRAVHLDKGTAHEPIRSVRSANQKPAADPRLSSRSRQDLSSPSTQAVPPIATGGRAEDPRRRDQSYSQSSIGAGRDPRRRGSSISQQPGVPGSSDLYERLPAPVKSVVNSMRHEGRLQEPLNDNVVTRLLHLPERVALQAVENFSNVDLSQVENLQGFLVGIINRVNEKAIASEHQHRSQVASPRGHPPSAIPLGGNYGAPPQGGSVLGGPPQGGRLNSNNVANGGGYRGQPAHMATGPAPALYERPYDAPQDTRDPRRRQPAPQGPPQYGGALQRPPPAGIGHGPIGMPSFAVLPLSVQNHVHALVANRTLASLEELGGKCYEVLGQLSEPLANQVLTRFAGANLSNVRNKSGFLIGVVKRARQEYGFD